MSYHVVIPARYASSRLPGKPLLDIESGRHHMPGHEVGVPGEPFIE